MPNIKVDSYSVGVIRRKSEMIKRFITCVPEPGNEAGIDSLVIYFLPYEQSVGYYDQRTVVGFLPPEDYRDVYHVLQTESPVYINWALKGEKDLEYLSVGTRQEPPGEGFEDRSG